MPGPRSYPNINTLWSTIIADELARSGVRDVVISPGSRSTALVLACTGHADLCCHSQLDERAAAFYALGLARAGGRAVVLICTSGTAAANYYPAVCEADASGVPLLLLTADRPAHLRHSGAPQTMDQVKLYGDRVRLSCDLAQPEADDLRLRALRATICHAVARCSAPVAGPVHCNVPYRKPLEPIDAARAADQVPDAFLAAGGAGLRGRRSGQAWTQFLPTTEAVTIVADALLRADRPVIFAGPDARGERYAAALFALARMHNIPVFAEAASQLRFRSDGGGIGSADLLLRSAEFRARFVPDCVITLGGTPTNSGLLRFFEETDAGEVMLIAEDLRRHDPAQRVSHHVFGNVADFLHDLQQVMTPVPVRARTEWNALISRADEAARASLDAQLAAMTGGLEGIFLASTGRLLRDGEPLILSSSMPIRDVETFVPALKRSVPVYCNRGVNGIDGVLSTALGVVRGSRRRGVLCIGDVAFLHNLNATAGADLASLPLTIVLLNNDGGEIFDLLPIREFDPAFTNHFLTPHGRDLSAIAEALGLQVRRIETRDEFVHAYEEAASAEGCFVIEVRTSIEQSGELRRSVLGSIAGSVDAAVAEFPLTSREEPSAFPLAMHRLRTGEGTPVVFLHGFTRSSASWRTLAARVGAGRPLYAVDLMGHGRAPRPDAASFEQAYTLDYAADALEALFARWGFSDLHLVGYSMGGRTAMVYAGRHTARLRSLGLLSAHPGIEDADARRTRFEADQSLAARIKDEGLDAFVASWSENGMFGPQKNEDPLRWHEAVRDRFGQQAHALAASLRGCGQGAQTPQWSVREERGLPVLFLAGQRDARYAETAARIAALRAHGEVHIIADAGHDLLFDCEEEVAALLETLWERA